MNASNHHGRTGIVTGIKNAIVHEKWKFAFAIAGKKMRSRSFYSKIIPSRTSGTTIGKFWMSRFKALSNYSTIKERR